MYFVRTTTNLEHVLQQASSGADKAHPDKRTMNGVCDQPTVSVAPATPPVSTCGAGCGATVEVLVAPTPTSAATLAPVTEVPTVVVTPTEMPTATEVVEEETPVVTPVPTMKLGRPTSTPFPDNEIIPQQDTPLPACSTGAVPCGNKG